jgi:hypothetical protein
MNDDHSTAKAIAMIQEEMDSCSSSVVVAGRCNLTSSRISYLC